MRIATWNINSVRLRIDTLRQVMAALAPDVLCLQEIKVVNELFPHEAVAALGLPHQLVHGEKGYNGVAILARVPIVEIERRRWCDRTDCRHMAARLPGGIELHNFYIPAGGDIPDPAVNDKFAHKLGFLAEMEAWAAALPAGKRVLVGDLNIAPLETDVWSHKALLNVVSHTPVETEGLGRIVAAHGWVDAVRRVIPPEERLYTWWSYRNREWPGSDRGRRLDHVWVSPPLADAVTAAHVLREARGWDKPSDHVPVAVDLNV